MIRLCLFGFEVLRIEWLQLEDPEEGIEGIGGGSFEISYGFGGTIDTD